MCVPAATPGCWGWHAFLLRRATGGLPAGCVGEKRGPTCQPLATAWPVWVRAESRPSARGRLAAERSEGGSAPSWRAQCKWARPSSCWERLLGRLFLWAHRQEASCPARLRRSRRGVPCVWVPQSFSIREGGCPLAATAGGAYLCHQTGRRAPSSLGVPLHTFQGGGQGAV